MANPKTKSLPKLALYNFVVNAEPNTDCTLEIPIPVEQADSFVHNMRVEMSRLRDKVREAGRTPSHFKILYISKSEIDENSCNIVLKKATKGTSALLNNLDRALLEAVSLEETHDKEDKIDASAHVKPIASEQKPTKAINSPIILKLTA